MLDIKTATLDTLLDKLARLADWNDSNIVFLLGAGCSRSSGVPGAQELASRWLRELRKDDPSIFPDIDEKKASDHYFQIFEKRFTEDVRKQAINRFTKSAYPSVGYIIFANLLASSNEWVKGKKDRFKTVLTTNFDSLIEQAFILFTSERPVVIPDPSLIKYSMDGDNINVIKLHGDSRYAQANEFNSVQEIPENVRNVISGLVKKGILVVLGYAGAEKGVAELIAQLVSSESIKQIWWVDSKPPGLPIQNELSGKAVVFYHVNHVNFDELMLMLKQKIMSVPHVSATRMDEHVFKYHDSLMWNLGLYGNDGKKKIEIRENDFKDYFKFFVKAATAINQAKPKAEALSILDLGMSNHSQSANYNIFLGAFYKSIMKDRDKAIQLFKRAKELAPEHSGARAALANTLKEVENAMAVDVRESIIDDFDKAEKLDPLNINNTLNYAGFLLALDSEDRNLKGKIKLENCVESLYEPGHRIELAFYVFAHNLEEFGIDEHLNELKTHLADNYRSPDFSLDWNVKKAISDNHPHSNLVSALAIAINSDPATDIGDVLEVIDVVLGKPKADGSEHVKVNLK